MTPEQSSRIARTLAQGARLRASCAEAIAQSRTLRAQAMEIAILIGKNRPSESSVKQTTDSRGIRASKET